MSKFDIISKIFQGCKQQLGATQKAQPTQSPTGMRRPSLLSCNAPPRSSLLPPGLTRYAINGDHPIRPYGKIKFPYRCVLCGEKGQHKIRLSGEVYYLGLNYYYEWVRAAKEGLCVRCSRRNRKQVDLVTKACIATGVTETLAYDLVLREAQSKVLGHYPGYPTREARWARKAVLATNEEVAGLSTQQSTLLEDLMPGSPWSTRELIDLAVELMATPDRAGNLGESLPSTKTEAQK